MKLSRLLACGACAVACAGHAQELTKANNTTALNLPGSWVENAAPTPADTLVWNSTVAAAANSNTTMGAGFEVAGLRVEAPAADVRISGATLALTNGVAGITVTNTRSLYIDTPVATLAGSAQSWTVGTGRQLGLGRVVSLGAGTLSVLGTGTVVFAEKIEDLAGRAAPLTISWNGPAGAVGTAAARKGVILTDRGSDEVTVNMLGGSLTVNAPNDNYGLAIGMKQKETWNLSGGTVTADSGSALHLGGAGNYAGAAGEGVMNLSATGKFVAQGTLPFYLARPSLANNVGVRATVNLNGGSLETSRAFWKIPGSAGNAAAFHFNGGLLKATGSIADWFQNLDTLDVQEGGADVEVAAYALAQIRQPLTHGGLAETDGGLAKTGAGALGVSNAFTGDISVQAGTLGLENVPAGNVTVAAGAGLAFKNPADLAAALADTTGKYTVDSAALAGLYALTSLTNPSLPGLGGRGFVKMGSGAVTLTSSAALSGATNGVTVAGGTLNYSAASAVPSGSPITVYGGGQLVLNYSASMTLAHPLTLAGNYDVADGGGSLYIAYNGGTATFNAPITLAGDTKIKTFSTTSTVNLNQPIGGTGNLVIGAGGSAANHYHTINLNAASTFAGDVTLKSDSGANARFNWGVDNAMPAASVLMLGGPAWNSTYAMIDLNGHAQTTKGLADAATVGAIRSTTNSSSAASVLTLTDSASRSYSGALGGRIDIVKTGSGTQSLLGSGLNHTGSVSVQSGILVIAANALPNADLTVASGRQVQPNAAGTFTVGHSTLSGTGPDSRGALYFGGFTPVVWNGRITLAGDTRLGAYGVTLSRTFTGSIDGAGSLNIWAGGGGNTHENTVVLSGQSTFAGALNMEASFGANLTVKLSGGNDRLPAAAPLIFAPSWDSGANRAFCRLDLLGSSQRAYSLVSGGHADHCRAVVNSAAGTTGTLTLNTVGGTAVYEGVIGASGPCPSAGGLNVVKEGGGAQLFKKGSLWYWNTGVPGTNFINADITVNAGAVGFSGTDVLGPTNRITVSAGGALIATNKAVLAALMADPRVTLDPASGVGVYDGWDVTAADLTRPFYYSGTATNTTDNTATFLNGVSFAAGIIHINREGAAGDATFGPVAAPLYLNGTTLKNFNTSPILAAARTITINAGGAAFTAGWVKNLTVLSKLTGAGALNVNCDSGFVILSNAGNDYAGDTTIATLWAGSSGATGKLKLGASEVIPHGAGKGNVVLNAGATLDLNGFSETVNGLSSVAATALVTNSSLTASTLTVGANDATSSYAGRLGGAVSLVKTGAGTLTLAAPCGHTGPTTVSAGTLALGGACTIASAAVEVRRGATLSFVDGDAFGGASSVSELFVGEEGATAGAQGRLSIPAGVEVTVLHFAIDGRFKKAGTWGATGSGAAFADDAIFAGGGTLRVLETGPQRGTVLLFR